MDWAVYLEYLKLVLKEFNLIDAVNKNILIQYFQDDLCFFIQTQLVEYRKDLDIQEEIIKNTIDIEAKVG